MKGLSGTIAMCDTPDAVNVPSGVVGFIQRLHSLSTEPAWPIGASHPHTPAQ